MNDPAAKVRVLYSVPEAMALLNLSSMDQIRKASGNAGTLHSPSG